jgi:hypothetical protein
LTHKLPDAQKNLSTCPVACDSVEGGSKKMNTIMVETIMDITERCETGDNMINISHAFGMINETFSTCWVLTGVNFDLQTSGT